MLALQRSAMSIESERSRNKYQQGVQNNATYCLTLHTTNAKRAFDVDLDECHTRIHIVDL